MMPYFPIGFWLLKGEEFIGEAEEVTGNCRETVQERQETIWED